MAVDSISVDLTRLTFWREGTKDEDCQRSTALLAAIEIKIRKLAEREVRKSYGGEGRIGLGWFLVLGARQTYTVDLSS